MLDFKSLALGLKLYKSGGIPVSAGVHRRLVAANQARDRRDWRVAAEGYQAALDIDDSLAHIWIQLGHARKELSEFEAAEAAYQRSARLAPNTSEAPLHLGHLRKLIGDLNGANRLYIQAARLDPGHPDVLAEVQGMDIGAADFSALLDTGSAEMSWPEPATLEGAADAARAGLEGVRAILGDRLRDLPPDTREKLASLDKVLEDIVSGRGEGQQAEPSGPILIFDVSDLISYFRNARLPTGIQRVQIEIIVSAIENGRRPVKICSFVDQRDNWFEIPPAAFQLLSQLSLSAGDRHAADWTLMQRRLQILLNTREPFVFPRGAFLINLGTSWWLQNYFLFVRKAKAQYGIRYVPFVHDLIPIKARQHCTKELTQDFISWALGAFDHADFFLANSEATKRDLMDVAAHLGHDLSPDHVGVVRLDADFRKQTGHSPDPKLLEPLGLSRTPYVLFVSTIESRKNHRCAFEAWTNLIRKYGTAHVPKLVCVGNRGWLNDAVYAELESNERLAGSVMMLSGLSDAQLAALYQGCLFTLYPSSYEGWGLPVTESLCYGKIPVVSDAASLPESAGPYGVYFENGSARGLTDALERMLFEPHFRRSKEREIIESFRPRPWRDLGEEMVAYCGRWDAAGRPSFDPPQAQLGSYHAIVRNFETRVWPGMRSAEIFRSGSGWWGPDNFGCWTKSQGGELEIGLPDGHEPLRIHFQLHGPPGKACSFTLKIAGARPMGGLLEPGEFRWLTVDLPPADHSHPVLRARLDSADTTNLAEVTGTSDIRTVGVGLAGFFISAAEDAASRLAFVEAVALRNLSSVSFGRESRVESQTSRRDAAFAPAHRGLRAVPDPAAL